MSLIFDSLKSLDESGPVTIVQAPFNKSKWHEKAKRRGQVSMSLILITVATLLFVTLIAFSHLFVGGGVEAVSVKKNEGVFYEDSNRKENKSDDILRENEVHSVDFEHDPKNNVDDNNTTGEKHDGKKGFHTVVDTVNTASRKAGFGVVSSISAQNRVDKAVKKQTSVNGQTELKIPKELKPDQTVEKSLRKSVETIDMHRKVERQLIEELRQKMLVALSSNNHADAERALISLTEMLGESSPFVEKMSAFFYLETKQYQNALGVYQRILIRDTQDNNARMQIAKVATVLGNVELARKQLIFLVEQKEYRSEARQLLQEIRYLSDAE